MKKGIVLLLMLFSIFHSYSQGDNNLDERSCITFGLLQGGGSLAGADLELLVGNRLGLQIGGGFVGYGAGLNFHLKPSIRSNFISLAYWHQGLNDSYTQSLAGPTFVWRGKKWFTAQMGIGATLEKGPAWPVDIEHPPVQLMYSIGAYIPW
ncbi:MAG: hypothetical protein OEW67_08125 [Cyclobacteriaceae bacterium]|nr:hypothetical protein [Cyclobacteriaceae bacterium]